jgi:hypothetical protein
MLEALNYDGHGCKSLLAQAPTLLFGLEEPSVQLDGQERMTSDWIQSPNGRLFFDLKKKVEWPHQRLPGYTRV